MRLSIDLACWVRLRKAAAAQGRGHGTGDHLHEHAAHTPLTLRKLDPKESELELVRKPPKVSRGCGGVARAARAALDPGEAYGCRVA